MDKALKDYNIDAIIGPADSPVTKLASASGGFLSWEIHSRMCRLHMKASYWFAFADSVQGIPSLLCLCRISISTAVPSASLHWF